MFYIEKWTTYGWVPVSAGILDYHVARNLQRTLADGDNIDNFSILYKEEA